VPFEADVAGAGLLGRLAREKPRAIGGEIRQYVVFRQPRERRADRRPGLEAWGPLRGGDSRGPVSDRRACISRKLRSRRLVATSCSSGLSSLLRGLLLIARAEAMPVLPSKAQGEGRSMGRPRPFLS